MTQAELTIRYSALDSTAKVRFLAIAAHILTVSLRSDYDSPDLPERLHRLQGANELQHHLSAELLHHHDGDLKRYPDDVLIALLIEKAAYYRLGGDLGWAVTQAIERAQPQTRSTLR